MKPSRPPVSLDREVARRAAGAIVGLGQGQVLGDVGAHQRQRQVLVEPRLAADLAHRHDLDQRQVDAAAVAPADQLVEFHRR